MPRMCSVCGKTYARTVKRSHSMRPSIVRLQPNLQWTKLGTGQRVKACARCIRNKSKASKA